MGIFDRIKSAISGATGNFIAISDAEKLFLTVVEFGKPYALAQVAKDLTRRVGYEFDVTTMNVADPKFQSILKAREDLLKAATKQSTERMVPSANQGMRDLQFASLFFYYFIVMRAISLNNNSDGVRARHVADQYSSHLLKLFPR